MINFESFTLDNGLKVFVHEDPTVQIAVMNILYDVGSRDENPERTGFAHLFEHLMFGGSVNIPNYDTPLQLAGGENNAFTADELTRHVQLATRRTPHVRRHPGFRLTATWSPRE